MRAVMVNVPESLLAERRRTGADLFDEMWEGVLHMVPAPSAAYQRLNAKLISVLLPLAEARGLVPLVEANLYHADDDYRVPHQLYARPDQLSDRGAEGAAVLVVEILSPGDETYDKLDWYAAGGVDEVLVVDPDTRQARSRRIVTPTGRGSLPACEQRRPGGPETPPSPAVFDRRGEGGPPARVTRRGPGARHDETLARRGGGPGGAGPGRL